jgi:hypothetical protein
MNLVLSLEAIGCLINGQSHRDLNPYAVGSLIKKFKPDLSDSDLACLSQVKRFLHEGEDCVINLLINLYPNLVEGVTEFGPPDMRQIKKTVVLRKTGVLCLKSVA